MAAVTMADTRDSTGGAKSKSLQLELKNQALELGTLTGTSGFYDCTVGLPSTAE